MSSCSSYDKHIHCTQKKEVDWECTQDKDGDWECSQVSGVRQVDDKILVRA